MRTRPTTATRSALTGFTRGYFDFIKSALIAIVALTCGNVQSSEFSVDRSREEENSLFAQTRFDRIVIVEKIGSDNSMLRPLCKPITDKNVNSNIKKLLLEETVAVGYDTLDMSGTLCSVVFVDTASGDCSVVQIQLTSGIGIMKRGRL